MVNRIRIFIFFGIFLAQIFPAGAETTVHDRLKSAMTGDHFRPADTKTLNRAESLFRNILDHALSEALSKEWEGLGFELTQSEISGKPVLLLYEKEDRREGRGFYLFHLKAPLRLGLQIPHGFKDLDTDTIGLDLAAEIPFAAAAWNTVPRYSDRDGVRIDSDLAHLPRSYFTALARAFARKYPSSFLVQIHGYADSKRKTLTGRGFDLIISSGTRSPHGALGRLDSCMEEHLFVPVGIYPIEVQELGGTTNTIGALLRNVGYDGFIHMEMDRSFRLKMRDDPTFRGRFTQCLIQSLH